MGRFLLGLVVGIAIGIFAMTLNPELPEQLRVSVANLTATVMRGAEEAAESVGDAAEEAANEADRATDDAPPPETAAERAGEAVEESAEEVGEAVEDAARATGEAVEDTVDEAERARAPDAAGNQ